MPNNKPNGKIRHERVKPPDLLDAIPQLDNTPPERLQGNGILRGWALKHYHAVPEEQVASLMEAFGFRGEFEEFVQFQTNLARQSAATINALEYDGDLSDLLSALAKGEYISAKEHKAALEEATKDGETKYAELHAAYTRHMTRMDAIAAALEIQNGAKGLLKTALEKRGKALTSRQRRINQLMAEFLIQKTEMETIIEEAEADFATSTQGLSQNIAVQQKLADGDRALLEALTEE